MELEFDRHMKCRRINEIFFHLNYGVCAHIDSLSLCICSDLSQRRINVSQFEFGISIQPRAFGVDIDDVDTTNGNRR